MSLMLRFVLAAVLAGQFFLPSQALAYHRRHARVYPTAVSGLVWDTTANRFYFAKNIDRHIYPASTTKVMTVILALEHLSLDQYVTVSPQATQVPETKLSVKAGEQYKVRDLIYAALLKSANDAANVLAEAVAGSQDKFVQMMNQKALELGAKHTHFADAHGLPSQGDQYTTARDMAIIFQEALKNDFFRNVITFKYRIIYSKDGRRFFLKSHNKALFSNWKTHIYGKTGYTNEARACFLGYFVKDGHTYIVDLYGCSKRWEDLKFVVERYGRVNL